MNAEKAVFNIRLLRDRLEMMGWEPPATRTIEELWDAVVGELERQGIGRAWIARMRDEDLDLVVATSDLLDCVEHSPNPTGELPVLVDLLGVDLVASLTGVSVTSFIRYRKELTPPNIMAVRLHMVAMICADLRGSYRPNGIARWFNRPRPQLDRQRPRDLLEGAWDPQDAGPAAVRELARPNFGMPAT